MGARTFGFTYPVNYDSVTPGTIVTAQTASGRRIVGLAFKGRYDMQLAVFQQEGTEPPLPYVIELAEVHQTASVITGELEFEPAEGAAFSQPLDRRSATEGVFVATNGAVGLSVRHSDFAGRRQLFLDFATGEPIEGVGLIGVLPVWKLYIRQPGREERFELDVS